MSCIKTKNLEEKIIALFNLKSADDINEEILNKVEDITLNRFNYKQELIEYDFSDLENLKNLKSIILRDFKLDGKISSALNKLSNLETVVLDNCYIENGSKIDNLIQKIYISNCSFECISFFYNKEAVRCITMLDIEDFVDVYMLNNFKNIEKLEILNSSVVNVNCIKEFKDLKILNLSGSMVDDVEEINKLKINVIKDVKFYNIV